MLSTRLAKSSLASSEISVVWASFFIRETLTQMTMNHQSSGSWDTCTGGNCGYLRIVQASFCRRIVRLYFLTFFEIKHGHGLALSNEIWAEVMCISPRWKFQEPVCDISCFHPLTTETVTVYVEMEHLWTRFLLWWGTLLTSLVDITWVENLFTVVRTLSFLELFVTTAKPSLY